ncbi:hypothetical protein [Shewanella sp. YLB-07]|uniref:hypothetical protein n=1 Tax=Shewanella sp. YLB-07 TaxID=2601268 RepID=UPI00128B314F|nr:hypothetical protein [Shewanella sp. YLB-07]MPY23984.1 hypothetical protein [Shewanella sp. YLB-07]
MNELAQVSLSSSSLRGLDLVSSSKALPKGELSRFNPRQVPLPSANSGLTGDISTKAQQTRDEATLADTEAKKLGVDIAKSGFFAKLGSLALTGVALGVSIAATVLTGGAGLPLLIASGVAFTLAVADAGCAFADWRSKAGGGEGLAMGGDAVANGVNALLGKMGVADDKAQWWGKAVSITSRVALTVGTLWSAIITPASLPGSIAGTVSMVNMARKSAGPVVTGIADLAKEAPTNKAAKLKSESQEKILSAKGLEANEHQFQVQQGRQEISELGSRLKESEANIKAALFDAEMRTKQSEQRQRNNNDLRSQLDNKDNKITDMEAQLMQLTEHFSRSKSELSDVMQQLKALQQILLY